MASHLVLVVDDEPLVRMVVAETLRDAGFDVLEAEDAFSALDVLQAAPGVRLLFTDVQMPGRLDGIDLALLAKARHPHVRVIITSGYSPKGTCIAGVPFLPKPFSHHRLVELARAEVADQAGDPPF